MKMLDVMMVDVFGCDFQVHVPLQTLWGKQSSASSFWISILL